MSEFSDASAAQSTSAMNLVRKIKSRASFRGLLDTGVAEMVTSDSTTTDSSGLPYTKDFASLEWDSCFRSKSNRTSMVPMNNNYHRVIDVLPGPVVIDSGSDFGASLTSESPELNKHQPNSPASLEWEEEFLVESSSASPLKIPKPEPKNFNEQVILSRDCFLREDCAQSDFDLDHSRDLGLTSPIGQENDRHWNCAESGFVDDGVLESVPKRRCREQSSNSTVKKNRDSAFCDGLDIGFSRIQENIGEKWELVRYSETEWRGHTQRAETIRRGYAHIPSSLDCHHLRRIRGDNYCALRASLFQVLEQGVPLLASYDDCQSVCQTLETWANSQRWWLQNWSFGSRLPYSREKCIQGFKDCLESLHRLSSVSIRQNENREEFLVDQFNSDPYLDVRLMEAVKLLMFVKSVDLYDANLKGADIPIFAILLFARETSETPQAFMEKHMNFMGDSGGLEQVEMYLLGHTLGVTLRIVRPSCYDSEDYICYYPERSEDCGPEINLIAEDDRHYNIIIK